MPRRENNRVYPTYPFAREWARLDCRRDCDRAAFLQESERLSFLKNTQQSSIRRGVETRPMTKSRRETITVRRNEIKLLIGFSGSAI